MGRTAGRPGGRGGDPAGDSEAAIGAAELEALVEGTTRVQVERVAPLTHKGYCGQAEIAPDAGPAQIVEDIRRAYGGGRYMLRPLGPSGRYTKGSVTVYIAGEPHWPSHSTTTSAPAVGTPSAPTTDHALLELLREQLRPQHATPTLGGGGTDLTTLISLARLLTGNQQPAPPPVDMTQVFTALLSQQRAATDPIAQLTGLMQLMQGQKNDEEDEPKSPEDRMWRMAEMMFLSKMMGPGPQMQGAPQMPGTPPQAPFDPRQLANMDPRIVAQMFPGMVAGAQPQQPQQPQQPAQAPQPGYPPQQAAQAPQPGAQAVEEEDDDDEWLPTPGQLAAELATMDPARQLGYVQEFMRMAQANRLVFAQGAAPPAPSEPPTSEPEPEPPAKGPTLLGGGY